MAGYRFLESISSPQPILADGAMGTMLHQRGASFDQCFDELNQTQPALVAEIHRDYIQAGAQIIKTNTFGANRYKLGQRGLEERVAEINRAGVDLAKRVVAASFKSVFIAGDVGPLGVRLAPFGRVRPEQARQAFSEQISALVSAGIDLLLIETMTDCYEAREAILAAHALDADLPVLASMTFTRDDRTVLGDDPAKVATTLAEAGAQVIGINCSGGPAQLLRILKQMKQAVPEGRFSVMPNAGWPERVGGRIMYPAGPEYFGEYALAFCKAGAVVIGGCCGTTPDHISSMRKALDLYSPDGCADSMVQVVTDREESLSAAEQPTQMAQKLAQGKFMIAVEMDPPRGLSTHKLLAGASLMAEAGADVIDVADSPMARMRMSPWAVCSLIQQQAGIETVLHFPTRGRNLLRVQGDLLAAHALGVRNVFVVMGDPTAIGDYPEAMDNFDLVPSGVIKLVKQGFNVGVDHSGATIGQPTSFFCGCALNLTAADPRSEIINFRRKLKAGADFALTQPVFTSQTVKDFLEIYQEQHGEFPIPLLVGILPLVNARHAAFLHHEVPGISIPEITRNRMEAAGDTDNGAREGIKIAVELIRDVKPYVRGVYLMPAFSRYDGAAEIIETIQR